MVGCFINNLLLVLLYLTQQHLHLHTLLREKKERDSYYSHASFFFFDEFVVFVVVFVVYDESGFDDAFPSGFTNVQHHREYNIIEYLLCCSSGRRAESQRRRATDRVATLSRPRFYSSGECHPTAGISRRGENHVNHIWRVWKAESEDDAEERRDVLFTRRASGRSRVTNSRDWVFVSTDRRLRGRGERRGSCRAIQRRHVDDIAESEDAGENDSDDDDKEE